MQELALFGAFYRRERGRAWVEGSKSNSGNARGGGRLWGSPACVSSPFHPFQVLFYRTFSCAPTLVLPQFQFITHTEPKHGHIQCFNALDSHTYPTLLAKEGIPYCSAMINASHAVSEADSPQNCRRKKSNAPVHRLPIFVCSRWSNEPLCCRPLLPPPPETQKNMKERSIPQRKLAPKPRRRGFGQAGISLRSYRRQSVVEVVDMPTHPIRRDWKEIGPKRLKNGSSCQVVLIRERVKNKLLQELGCLSGTVLRVVLGRVAHLKSRGAERPGHDIMPSSHQSAVS